MDGVYTLTTQYERDPACPVCSAGVPMTAPPTCTLRDLLGLLTLHPALGRLLREPSLSVGSVPLYARGVFEEETRPNLDRQLRELVTGPLVELTVNDKGLVAPLKVNERERGWEGVVRGWRGARQTSCLGEKEGGAGGACALGV